ncbi:MAG: alpha-amylase family glycosyl hydrolase [Candidatus Sericytochromatia bacterium]|nr:alpha-amylase family glycosyl hydrolase [Candidatus Sericytochromatia bacterium]
MSADWAHDAIVYHLYPLGALGAPPRQDLRRAPVNRLVQLRDWIPHWQALGVNTLYLGPLFESSTHGYDTIDYFRVDRRLGDNAALAELVRELHAAGFRVLLDAVLNHVGRGHAAFRDLQAHGARSAFAPWFKGLRFDRGNPAGDAFDYDTWAGHHDLVKLDLTQPAVRDHLFEAVTFWIRTFDIDGLRLDAADVMDLDFLRDLAAHCKALRPDFWLMGEVVHGDYSQWANPQALDATTNYEAYDGLHKAHNARDYGRIAHALERQFGPSGVYRGLPLYSFADNHDVDRIASLLKRPAHLFPLHVLLFTMPGVPSVYYGSEWALPGKKGKHTDAPLRPALQPPQAGDARQNHELARAIARLTRLRGQVPALRRGDYRSLAATPEQLVFERRYGTSAARVAVNASERPVTLTLEPLDGHEGHWVDLLNPGERFPVRRDRPAAATLYPTWGRVLVFEPARVG